SLLAGNEREPALSDATRIALDLTLGAKVGHQWHITVGNVSSPVAPFGDEQPTIIASNPPFGAMGSRPDMAIDIIAKYVDRLPPGGLLSVICPRSLLASNAGTLLRRKLLDELNMLEIWTLPSGS